MPTNVKVKVSDVSPTTIQSAAGKDLNYIVLKGYDDTNSKGFSKRFFATKQDGTATKNAEVAETLAPNDWVEVEIDDSSYKNVTRIRKISEPAGGSAPDQTNYKSNAGSAGGSSSKGSSRDAGMLNRATALEAAVKVAVASPNGVPSVNTLIDIAVKFESYIMYGIGEPIMTMDTPASDPEASVNPDLEDVGDDDIPF
jgi:hypothetical protein